MMEREEINKVLGRLKDGSYVFLQSVFEDTMNTQPFKGATGVIMMPVSKFQEAYRLDLNQAKDYLFELWQSSVADGQTEMGLDEYVEWVVGFDGREALFDMSYYSIGEKIAELHNKYLIKEHGNLMYFIFNLIRHSQF